MSLFYEDVRREQTRTKILRSENRVSRVLPAPRPMPPIPDTGWIAPREFPRLDAAELIAIDCETYDPNLLTKGPGAARKDGHIVGIAVGTNDGQRWYFPIRHEVGGGNLDTEAVLRWARDQFSRPNQPKVGANLPYDLEFLAAEGVTVAGPFWDVQIAEPLLDENAAGYSLDDLGWRYLKEGKTSSALYDWCARAYGGRADKWQRANIYRTPASLVGPYAEGDVDLPLRIFEKQVEQLEAEKLWELFELESSLLPMLLAMRLRGVRIDPVGAEALDRALSEMVDEMQQQYGVEIWAAESIARACDRAGIVYPRTAKTKAPSFTADWLETQPHPLLKAVLNARRWDKARGTFVRGYILGNHVDGRVHCQFHQQRSDEGGTVSGRFSSSHPNLQNVPARDEELGPLIRGLFLPEEGEDWGRLDWSQIEFRGLVHYGVGRGADIARRMYRDDPTTDFHQMVSELTGVPRKPAKNINFGLVYGMGKEKLARSLGKSLTEAEPLFEQYHTKLPFVRETYRATSDEAERKGYISTLLGRRRRFSLFEPRYSSGRAARLLTQEQALKEYGHDIKRAGTHKALNSRLQGSAADIMKKAMALIWESGVCDVLGAPLVTVHDELGWSVPRTKAGAEAFVEVKRIMETCVKLKVPLIAETEMGPSWGELK